MQMMNVLQREARVLATVSGAYFLACFVSVVLIKPLYVNFTLELPYYVNLFFLPHGVRVLSAWLLGWRAIYHLFPVSYLCGQLFFDSTVPILAAMLWPMVGVVTVVIIFGVTKKFIPGFANVLKGQVNWQDIVLIGCLASFVNTVFVSVVTGHGMLALIGFFVGDVMGMIACMFTLMLLFRAARS